MVRSQPLALSRVRDPVPGTEPAEIRLLQDSGLPVAPMVLVPAAAEEDFYRLNNLVGRLEHLFSEVDLLDPDEDDVEEAAPAAVELVRGSFLLDEFIDSFYDAVSALPAQVTVRRPGAEGTSGPRGRRSLLALKALWSLEWSFEAVWGRLEAGKGLLPEPAPVLVHETGEVPLPASTARTASSVLGRRVALLGTADGRLTRIAVERPPQAEGWHGE